MTIPVSNTLDTTTPDAGSVTVKRARKPRTPKPPAAPKPPKAERAKRATPARTLRVRIHDLAGDAGLDAFDHLRKKGGEAYEASVREAFDAQDYLERAYARKDQLRAQLDQATIDHDLTSKIASDARPVIDRLLLAAKRLASLDADDVEPDADDSPHGDDPIPPTL